MNDDNPYGLPPVPPPNPYAGQPYGQPPTNPYESPFGSPTPPQPPNPFANPYNPGGYAPPPGPPPSNQGFNPYAPPSVGAQGPGWAQGFGFEQPLASPGSRLGARMLDGMLLFGVAFVSAIPGAVIGDEVATGFALLGWMALTVYQWYLLSTTGQTLGKKWLGIRVVKVDGSPIDFASAVVMRIWVLGALTFVGSLLIIGGILPLVDALMVFTDDHRCLHDHLAGTKVVVA